MTEPRSGLAEQLPAPEWLTAEGGPAAGMRLAFRAYPAALPRPPVHVLISHGFAEHSGWWQHVALALQAQGVSAYLFDHFHHGISAGRPLDVRNYDVLAAGLRLALEAGVLPRSGDAPVVLLAHSNGGLVALWALSQPAPQSALQSAPRIASQLRGLVLCSPLIQMPPGPKWMGLLPAWAMARVNPGLYWPLPLRARRLTTDVALWPTYTADTLRLHIISVGFFLAMRAAGNRIAAHPDVAGLPLLLLSAEQEAVVDRAAMLRWYERVRTPDKTHLPHPGRRHELFNEVDWTHTVGEVVSWLRQRFPQR